MVIAQLEKLTGIRLCLSLVSLLDEPILNMLLQCQARVKGGVTWFVVHSDKNRDSFISNRYK